MSMQAARSRLRLRYLCAYSKSLKHIVGKSGSSTIFRSFRARDFFMTIQRLYPQNRRLK